MENAIRTQDNVCVNLELSGELVPNQCKHIISRLYISFRTKQKTVELQRTLQLDMDSMTSTSPSILGEVTLFSLSSK